MNDRVVFKWSFVCHELQSAIELDGILQVLGAFLQEKLICLDSFSPAPQKCTLNESRNVILRLELLVSSDSSSQFVDSS